MGPRAVVPPLAAAVLMLSASVAAPPAAPVSMDAAMDLLRAAAGAHASPSSDAVGEIIAAVLRGNLALQLGAPPKDVAAGLLTTIAPHLGGLAALETQGCSDLTIGRICGSEDDVWPEWAPVGPVRPWSYLSIDLGGNDTYHARVGAAALPTIGLHIDLAGDDTYLHPGPTLGAAVGGGVGIALELAGDDTYRSFSDSQGFADLAAVGLLWDASGDDNYAAIAVSQGDYCACYFTSSDPLGLAHLRDEAGNDRYDCWNFCQGIADFGISAGVLHDVKGRDNYACWGGTNCRGNWDYMGICWDDEAPNTYVGDVGAPPCRSSV